MKFFHLADLHLGKRVNGFSMIEDQKYILDRIIELVQTQEPDAVLIAGDIYDKAIPPVEAVNLFDDFLYELVRRGLQVFVISGNHDSAERISYGGRIMDRSGIHISPRISGGAADVGEEDGKPEGIDAEKSAEEESAVEESAEEVSVIQPFVLQDAYGPVNIYLFPYIHPSVVRAAYPDEKVNDWTQAMDVLIRKACIDPEARNIAVAHQYVTASGVKPDECDSELKHIGGLDNVEVSVFEDFDYVALGHLHGPQRVGRDTVRYAGSPLKYSFSEENHKKGVTVVEIREKGCVEISRLALTPLRDLRTVRGTFEELMSAGTTASLVQEDYYRVILTDENDVDQALSRLRARFYHNLMELRYDNTRTRSRNVIETEEEALEKEPVEVLQELYLLQNGLAMNEFQTELAAKLIEEIWNTI
jgi:exonuclease SbcD